MRPAPVWSAQRAETPVAEPELVLEVVPEPVAAAEVTLSVPAAPVAAAEVTLSDRQAPVAEAPLTRRRARSLAQASLAAATPIDVALDAIDDEPVALPVVDTVAVVSETETGPAELPVADVAADLHDEARVFAEAVLADEADAHAIADEFEAAARLFSFTGETPIQVAAAAIADEPVVAQDAAEAAPAKRRRFSGAAFKRATAASATVGAMGIVGLLAIGMTTPAEAVSGAGNSAAASVSIATGSKAGTSSALSSDEIQAYVAPADAQVTALNRSDYSTASTAELAAESGITHYSNFFTNNANSPIQWPFKVGVSISYGFGMRDGTMHEGLDFTPGEGAEIQAVADGVVRTATESGGGYGVMIIIDHVIDGKLVSTRYGHMQYGSLQVKTGDTVKVGQFIGRVGDTGHSFGAHLHFEVLDNGTTAIDPLPWLRQHAGG
ncbi:murein DD-endopeptidase MepM/ murein hydrolase activator NlpD [Microbacterium sp. SORGH_AS428]|uniref:M23 family metallopeptidase n=1 Tax=Microbacterium sp. SORGH_AS_0428 TaxID=3041788 RepID=UPI002863BADF|nr:peptidoglycan DD-metalloendopeptidase family protein [Microbacterium sp. SORGH_AS_0428]MDR6200543.1 murein DD-endopeptidase MepM/ murein hydrolase activator NlpD [Microbacterium sp. SORGH_AS_0428]